MTGLTESWKVWMSAALSSKFNSKVLFDTCKFNRLFDISTLSRIIDKDLGWRRGIAAFTRHLTASMVQISFLIFHILNRYGPLSARQHNNHDHVHLGNQKPMRWINVVIFVHTHKCVMNRSNFEYNSKKFIARIPLNLEQIKTEGKHHVKRLVSSMYAFIASIQPF